ncbi:MAG: GntR family transcriptional regulator [Steroidobacteraceae bacterium]
MSEPASKGKCTRRRIRDVLVARILDGTYPAGTRLKELTLAREFDVSQAPIREALRELEGSGLVASERYRGTRVRGADYRDLRESYELRLVMEERALELAAPFSAELIEDLAARVRAMASAAEATDTERYIDEALGFHRRLVEASGNRTFLTVWDFQHWGVRGRMALRRRITSPEGGGLKLMVDLHCALSARIRAGDVRGAADTVRAIFRRITDVLEAS